VPSHTAQQPRALSLCLPAAQLVSEWGREGGREGGKEGERERASERARERGSEGGREGAREGGSEGAREGGSEGAREGGREMIVNFCTQKLKKLLRETLALIQVSLKKQGLR
jgi:hypothetical protein